MQKKRNAIIAIMAVVLVAALTVGGTLAYMTDSASLTNKFTVGDLDIDFEEPDYPGDCSDPEYVPGDSFPKNPTVTALKGDSYMRIVVRFLDADGTTVITDTDRLDLIKQVIYYDKAFVNEAAAVAGFKGGNLKVWAGPQNTHAPDATNHYTTVDLAALIAGGKIFNWFNEDDFTLDATRNTNPGIVYLNYTRGSGVTKGIFYQNDVTRLFTSIVFPSDWNQTHLNKIGNFYIEMTVQAIQATGLGDITEAMGMLDNEILGTEGERTLLVDYTARP